MFRSRARLQFLALLCTVAGAAAVGASDILTQFRLGQPAAETYVFDAVWNQGLGYFGAGTRIFKALPPEARAAAVTAAAQFAQAYTQTDAFRTRYAKEREASRPAPPPPAKSYQQQAEQRAQFDKSVAEMKANAAKSAPDLRKMLEDTVASLVAQQAAMEKDKALQAQMEKGHDMMNEMKQQTHVREVAEFERKYPADPQQLVATRLREFLALSASVPADAALVERDGKLRFVDPKLEGQSYFWKQLYRSGKPAVDAARAAATAWLAALEQKPTTL